MHIHPSCRYLCLFVEGPGVEGEHPIGVPMLTAINWKSTVVRKRLNTGGEG
jgi:hypothetical protein